jgi:hypothetical protein
MTENDEKKVDEQSSGSGGATGEPTHPFADPEEEPGAGREGHVQEIPIGIPMDPEEFRRLKAQAEQPSREADGKEGEADEDASTTRQED